MSRLVLCGRETCFFFRKRTIRLTADLRAGQDVVPKRQEKCLYRESNLGVWGRSQ